MNSKLAIFAALSVTAGPAFATVSLNFNGAFDTFVPQGLSNKSGVATNGLIWGILVDGNNDGISTYNSILNTGTKYDKLTGGLVSGQYTLSVSNVATDDVLIIGATNFLTESTAGDQEGDFSTTGGTGGIYSIAGITYNQTPVAGPGAGVGINDKFYVVWFDGLVGGTLTDASFSLPADGSSFVDFTAPFAGVDPNRTAGLAYIGTGGGSTGAGIALVPEPSAVLLGALGALGLLRRRRN